MYARWRGRGSFARIFHVSVYIRGLCAYLRLQLVYPCWMAFIRVSLRNVF